jgi:hypothetical protein
MATENYQVAHVVEWLRARPNTYHIQQQLSYYGWLLTGVWGGHVKIHQ